MASTRTVHLRIRVTTPPKGVQFCIQRGRTENHQPTVSEGVELQFTCVVEMAGTPADPQPNFLGPLAQGTPQERFIYLCSGQRAGQADSLWDRRAKLFLTGIDWERVEQVAGRDDCCLELTVAGTGADGGPVAAGVRQPLRDWCVSERG